MHSLPGRGDTLWPKIYDKGMIIYAAYLLNAAVK